MDKLKSMQVFLQVANSGSFSAAAEQLQMSRAMTSKYINFLENHLNVRLINRSTRRIKLSEEGLIFRDRITEILHELEETELSISNLNTRPGGTLRILSPTSFGSFHLPRAVTAYRKIYDQVKVELVLTESSPDIIEEGIDIVIHVGQLPDSSLIARKLSEVRMVICASPEYLDTHGRPRTPEDLANHNCLTYSGRHTRSEWTLTGPGGPYKLGVTGDFRSNVGDAIRISAIQGVGLAQLPTYMIGLDINSGRLEAVLEDFEPPARPVYALYLHRRHLSAKVRTFVEILQAQYSPEPYWDRWTRKEV